MSKAEFVCPQCGKSLTVLTASATFVRVRRKAETLIGLAALALTAFLVFRYEVASDWIAQLLLPIVRQVDPVISIGDFSDVLAPGLACLAIIAAFGGILLILHGSSVMSSDFALTVTLVTSKGGHKLFPSTSK